MCGIHVINLHIVLKLLKKHVRHYSMTDLLNLDKLEELGDVIAPICNSVRKLFEDAYDDVFMRSERYKKDVNMFYLQYKKDHNLTKQFSKDGKIFYHDVEV